jgi:hypothetical protein
MANTQHDPNQELIGQGIANIAAPLFGGFAATGAIARTAANIRGGADSPYAGLVHCARLEIPIRKVLQQHGDAAMNQMDAGRFQRLKKAR